MSNAVKLTINDTNYTFDINDPQLPDWVEERAFGSGNYPYKKKLKRSVYEKQLEDLQAELVKVQTWMKETGERIIMLFEGRDAAGKGGTINAIKENMHPRSARSVALSKPTDQEQGQWYYQRYIQHFPTAGEMILFDRSWYNRAGVEPVMGFCTPEQNAHFLSETPAFEKMIVRENVNFVKIWLNVGQEMQLKRFHDRRHSRLKYWKLSPIDIASLPKFEDYTAARNSMLDATHTDMAPWTIVRSNDKRRARLNVIRSVLHSVDYTGKDTKMIGEIDTKILGYGPDFLSKTDE